MMKRTGPRLGPDDPTPMAPQNPSQIQQAGASNMHTLAQSAQPQILSSSAMVSVGGGFGRGSGRAGAAPLINYLKPAALQYAPKTHHHTPQRLKTLPPQQPNLTALPTNLGRQSPAPSPMPTMAPNVGVGVGPGPQPPPGTQFQRLKVEDALSYLDQVKYKFNTQPQVYNDFLDIMKEFKSQTIDTPGVITRVSNLFKGHPELIVGFNTFLPPGYKIEVQSNGQVSVSMPSPSGSGGGVVVGVPQPQLVHLVPHHLSHQHHQPIHQQHQHQQHHAANTQAITSAVVHNLSVSAAPTNTLHQISQAHQQIEAAAIHHATPGSQQTTAHSTPAPASQPVEFNHAIEYVNKIKSRFSRQPDKYKRFLEILHAYQRGHREMKEPQSKQQTEQEVYSQVAKLFENQDDLLAEFGQFLPDAKAVSKPPDRHPLARSPPLSVHAQAPRADSDVERRSSPPHAHALLHAPLPKHTTSSTSAVPAPQPQHHHLKRSPSFSSTSQIGSGAPPAKKCRVWSARRDVSLADAAKLATVHEFNFFDRARKALRSHHVYDNFLRCLLLFTNEIISSSELLCVVGPFLCRHPELQKWLQDFLGPPSPPHTPTSTMHSGYNPTPLQSAGSVYERPDKRYEPIGPLGAQLRHDRPQGDAAMDIDLTTCKRLGTSYCALPRDAAARKCSGRTPLCKEVLNDTWVSFPTWSEDSTFVTSRKTQYEEYIYRCEDERFELDVVIETNASTIRVLEGVQKKLSRMTPDDAAKYRLDDCLGGDSPTVHQRALRRIYGDKAVDIIAGLKKNPVVAVPVVLRRLKAKEEEWREAQKGFNKQWREQNEKYYLKSLDHQGINFKQNDLKAMRSKSLFNEVEAAFAAHRPGPHVVIDYNMQSRQEAIKILRDTAELLIHHARRQTAIQKQEKRRIKQLLRHFIPDLFSHPRQPLSDDDDEEKEEANSPGSPSQEQTLNDKENNAVKDEKQESSESDNASDKSSKNNKNKENKPKNNNNTDNKDLTANSVKRTSSNEEMSVKSEIKSEPNDLEDDFRDYPPNENRFVCTSSWYLFLRAHGLLCARLAGARRACGAGGGAAGAGPAHALRLARAPPQRHYDALLDLVRALLDGNVDAPAYEDAAREMLGIEAYPAYTLDKLVSIAVRQLQHCVTEPRSTRAVELARTGGGSGAYVRRAARLLRREHSAFLVRVAAGERAQVAIELLAREPEHRTWPTDNPSPIPRAKPVFLLRNARARAPALPHNAHSQPQRARVHQQHARRKPPRPLDDGALLAFRPLHLYRRGALANARSTLAVNAKRRRDRFRAWLRDRH